MQEKPQDQALARRIATLRTMPVFADLAERDLASLAEDMRYKEYAKDETIFRQGDDAARSISCARGRCGSINQPQRQRNHDRHLHDERRDR